MQLPSSLLILAGAGDLPRLVAEGARAAGVKRVVVLGIRGSVSRRSLRAGTESGYVSLRAIAASLETIRKTGCEGAILAGQISPLTAFSAALGSEAREVLGSLKTINAHTVFGEVIKRVEAVGVKVLPSSLFLGAHIPSAATAGVLTPTAPTAEEMRDVEAGRKLALAICDLDIGQTVVVKNGTPLAVEGFDGTNSTILRGGRIARGGGAVVVKVAKHGHDMRFDIPVVGMRTLDVMHRAHCRVLAVQAGRTLVLNTPAFLARAERLGIRVVSFDDGLPSAPVF